MVHALEEIQRLLGSKGVLIDLHPRAEPYKIEAVQGEEILYSKLSRPNVPDEDVQSADAALENVVSRGLYARERHAEFEHVTYGSRVSEFREYWEMMGGYSKTPPDPEIVELRDQIYADVDEILHASNGQAEVAIREQCKIAKFSPRVDYDS